MASQAFSSSPAPRWAPSTTHTTRMLPFTLNSFRTACSWCWSSWSMDLQAISASRGHRKGTVSFLGETWLRRHLQLNWAKPQASLHLRGWPSPQPSPGVFHPQCPSHAHTPSPASTGHLGLPPSSLSSFRPSSPTPSGLLPYPPASSGVDSPPTSLPQVPFPAPIFVSPWLPCALSPKARPWPCAMSLNHPLATWPQGLVGKDTRPSFGFLVLQTLMLVLKYVQPVRHWEHRWLLIPSFPRLQGHPGNGGRQDHPGP